ncbi:MAG: mannose-6-phosphate isomerase [Lachnospiraceae bacterium]|jgi:mannose-6-phosphate isomerase class I|nr:mannose-6-phosphate isomerase [Lachnospiraceae bacterium]
MLLFFEPVEKPMVWGSESWTIGAHAHGDCKIKEGDFAGLTLSQLWRQQPELFGHLDEEEFPLLIKLIETKEDLSLQVHPDDDYVVSNGEGMRGKAECWYILECAEDATIILGHNAINREQLTDMVMAGRWNELIREIPIHPGDFIQLDPGTIHSIKGGIRLLETQQNCDITYRIFDFNRASAGQQRELHIRQGLDVITVPSREDTVIQARQNNANVRHKLYDGAYYIIWEMEVAGQAVIDRDQSFLIICVIEGEGRIGTRPIGIGDHFILTNGCDPIILAGNMKLIMSAPPLKERKVTF